MYVVVLKSSHDSNSENAWQMQREKGSRIDRSV